MSYFFSTSIKAQDETENLIEKLTNLPGASGFEWPVRNIITELWKNNNVDISVDNVGNVIARVKNKESEQGVLRRNPYKGSEAQPYENVR